MSAIEVVGLIIFYSVGVLLTMAAFGKVHNSSGYASSDDKTGAIVGSIFAWPICLIICLGILVYRKNYHGR